MINIAELLKDCAEGTELYSSILGPVEFLRVRKNPVYDDLEIQVSAYDGTWQDFDVYGRWLGNRYPDAECVLFPSKDCRTWEGWEAPVEPSFKTRDWVVRKDGKPFCSGNYAEQITLIGVDAKGKHMFLSSSTWVNEDEDVIRLWTIQDAKDGDVLVNQNGEMPFVFKSRKGNHIYCHCAYTNHKDIFFEKFLDDGRELHWINLFHEQVQPATKEQRDLLFKKMKEAGYTWDEKKKELKKIPIKPKFKVGNWLYPNCNGIYPVLVTGYYKWCGYQLQEGRDRNHLSRKIVEDEYHLWTIQDAKDGDVLVNDAGCIFINAGFEKDDKVTLACYCYVSVQGIFYEEDYKTGSWLYVSHIHPATKEQCDLLFKKMKEAGYTWDADKKELRKIKPHYDISYFMPKQWVLVRDCDNQVWGLSMFSHRDMGCYICLNREDFRQCIPFVGNEHLLGTTDPCDESFINW